MGRLTHLFFGGNCVKRQLGIDKRKTSSLTKQEDIKGMNEEEFGPLVEDEMGEVAERAEHPFLKLI